MKLTTPLTLDDFERHFQDRHLLHGTVEKWAREKPSEPALIDSDCDRHVSWAEFDTLTKALAMLLLERGFVKGDFFASLLRLNSEHIFLEYACLRIGAIFAPLNLKLGSAELMRNLNILQPSGFAFVKTPGLGEPAAFFTELRARFPLKLAAQFTPPEECAAGAVSMGKLLREARLLLQAGQNEERPQRLRRAYEEAAARVSREDGALMIFTTGSTGSPKAALLSHRNISCQAMGLSQVLLRGSAKELVTLVNLPPSHVGCQAEMLMSTIFDGGCAVLVPVFDPLRSVRAIAQ